MSIYNAPLTGASTAAITIATGLSQPVGLKLSGGVLYVADNTHGYVAIYNPPFSNASAPAITVPVAGAWGIGFDTSANLWVADVAGGNVQKFVPPFTNTSTPAITIATGLTAPEYPALDSSGNLYVSNGALIVVYTAPLSNTSAPAFTFPAPAPNGIRFGP